MSVATQLAYGKQLEHQRHTHSGPLVLGTTPLKYPAPTTDKDRTVLRRSEPRSRTALTGEQPDPWDLLQPQDRTSRHRIMYSLTRNADYPFIPLFSFWTNQWWFYPKRVGASRMIKDINLFGRTDPLSHLPIYVFVISNLFRDLDAEINSAWHQ